MPCYENGAAAGSVAVGAATIRAAAQGEGAAWERIVAVYERPLVRYAARLLGGRSGVEPKDCVQDAWVKVWEALPGFTLAADPARQFRGWLYRIVRNLIFDLLRHEALVQWQPLEALWVQNADGRSSDTPRRAFGDRLAETKTPDQITVSRDEREMAATRCRDLLAQIDPRQRAALLHRYFNELTYAEIARRMGTTRPAVKSLLHRGKAAGLAAAASDVI